MKYSQCDKLATFTLDPEAVPVCLHYEEWHMYKMTDSSGNFCKSSLDEYFENDYALRDCKEIMNHSYSFK